MNFDFNTLKKEERVALKLRSVYEKFGYRKYKMSRFEEYGFYMDYKSFLPSDRIISFTDMDGTLLALKPDVTLSIVKNAKELKGRFEKLYYVENVY
ncbi:MAG: ATP phosphoribosyltransferase regulatory subunit, partial [Clostridia bacterium]|nr:ATP phosphoribosyltransferase regulatory subunit [Clostridia bacterium]